MPYKSEHTARIKRVARNAKFWSKAIDNDMRVIMMNGSVQSIMFKTRHWTSKQAKAFLKKSGWKVLKFEEATETGE